MFASVVSPPQLVDGQLVWGKEADTARSAGHVYDWGDIVKVAAESAKATDAVFGKYAVRNPLTDTGVSPNINTEKAIESPVTHAIPALTTYGESENAERGAAIVGFDNMAAAFFLCCTGSATPIDKSNQRRSAHDAGARLLEAGNDMTTSTSCDATFAPSCFGGGSQRA